MNTVLVQATVTNFSTNILDNEEFGLLIGINFRKNMFNVVGQYWALF